MKEEQNWNSRTRLQREASTPLLRGRAGLMTIWLDGASAGRWERRVKKGQMGGRDYKME